MNQKTVEVLSILAIVLSLINLSTVIVSSDNTKVNKTGDNITGNLIINSSGSNDLRMEVVNGIFGSARSTGTPYFFMGLNLYYDNGWKYQNYNDTGTLFFMGSAQANGSNSFVMYQTYPAGTMNFYPLFGSSQTPGTIKGDGIGRLAIGSYESDESLHVYNISIGGNYTGGNVKIDGKYQSAKMTGAGNAYVCVNSTGWFYRGSPAC